MTTKTTKISISLSAVLFFTLSVTSSSFGAEPTTPNSAPVVQEQERERFQATMIGVRGRAASQSTGITITIDGTTSDEELNEYLELVGEGESWGPNSPLRSKLNSVRGLGRVAITGQVGTDLALVRRRQTEEGELITLMTARNLPFGERRRGGRSTNYPFSYLQMLIDKEGNGQGTVIIAARVMFSDEGGIEIESYGLQPFQLFNLRRR